MGKLKNNQRGFGAIEVLLIVLVVAVIGFGGYYVWNSRNNKNGNSASTTTTTPSTTTQSTTKTTTTPKTYSLKITELGIEIPLTASTSDIKYSWNDTIKTAELRSSTLMTAAKKDDPQNCTNSRAAETDGQYPLAKINAGELDYNHTAFTPDNAIKTVKVSGKTYYLYNISAGAGCDVSGTGQEYINLSKTYSTVVNTGFTSAKAVK